MNDEPKRVLIGTFPSGLGAVASFENIGERLVTEAAAKLDAARAEREERERVERETIRVNREWFLVTMRALMLFMERDKKIAAYRGDYDPSDTLARKTRRLRSDVAATLAYNERGPKR